MIESFALIIFLYFILGAFAGTLSGLLGIGGGVVIVPGLAYLFSLQPFPQGLIMHMAAGTSLAVIAMGTLRALYAHRRYKVKFFGIYRRLVPGIVVGVVLGVWLAHCLDGRVIRIIFGVFLTLIALRMFFVKKISIHRQLPGKVGMTSVGFLIGGKSGLLGIGGGAITTPFLTYCNVSMREAVMVAIAVSLTVSTVGAVMVGIVGSFSQGLPAWSTGYI